MHSIIHIRKTRYISLYNILMDIHTFPLLNNKEGERRQEREAIPAPLIHEKRNPLSSKRFKAFGIIIKHRLTDGHRSNLYPESMF